MEDHGKPWKNMENPIFNRKIYGKSMVSGEDYFP
jgi:hypothetical protein